MKKLVVVKFVKYEVDDDKLMMVVSDRISAFDFIMPNPVLDKGKILNKLSEFWFNLFLILYQMI